MKYLELVKTAAKLSGVSQSTAKSVIDSVCDIIRDTVENGNDVTLNNVGKFSQKTRAPRKGRNLVTKEVIEIPATNVVTFKVAKEFKDFINHK